MPRWHGWQPPRGHAFAAAHASELAVTDRRLVNALAVPASLAAGAVSGALLATLLERWRPPWSALPDGWRVEEDASGSPPAAGGAAGGAAGRAGRAGPPGLGLGCR